MSHNQDRRHEPEPPPLVVDLSFILRTILRLELRIMSQLDDQFVALTAALKTLADGQADLLTVITTRNDDDAQLIVAVGGLGTLVQRLFDATNQGGTVTNVDLQPALDQVNAILAAQVAAKQSLVDGVSKVVDATSAAVALTTADTPVVTTPPAPAPAPTPAPAPAPSTPSSTPPDTTGTGTDPGTGGATTPPVGDPGTGPSTPPPPVDDAFVAVGATRISDGLVQTADTLAAAIVVWNAAHPDQLITTPTA